MKNKYEIRGDKVAIFMNHKGKKVEAIIDLVDFDKVNSHPNSWYVDGSNGEDYMYAVGKYFVNGEKRRISMHRLVMDAPKHLLVDHINHITLDNTRSNLRLVTPSGNQQNIKSVRKDNKTSKLRNISYNKRSNKWIVYLNVNKNRYNFGQYNSLMKAEIVAGIVRKHYMPYSNEGIMDEEEIERLKELINPLKPRSSNKSSGIKYIHELRGKWSVRVKRKYYGVYETIDEAKSVLDKVLNGSYEHVPQKRGPKSSTLK